MYGFCRLPPAAAYAKSTFTGQFLPTCAPIHTDSRADSYCRLAGSGGGGEGDEVVGVDHLAALLRG
jgi:hypothetical protein